MKIEDVLNKTCLIGLSYININGDLLKQAQYAVPLSQRIRKKALPLSSTLSRALRKARKPILGAKVRRTSIFLRL